MKYVFKSQDTIFYRFPTHSVDLLLDRADANTSEVFMVVLNPGEAPPLHKHSDTEQIFYVIEGEGMLYIGDSDDGRKVMPGDLMRIPPNTIHSVHCHGDAVLRYLAVDCFMGGRPKNEPTWEEHLKVVCKEQGWDFSKINLRKERKF